MILFKEKFLILETKNDSLIFEIKPFESKESIYFRGKEYLSLFYYGKKIESDGLCPSVAKVNYSGSNNDYNYDPIISSTFGNGNNVVASILLKNVDGTNVNRFFFKSAKIVEEIEDYKGPHTRNISEILEILEEDAEAGLNLYTYITLFDDSNVISVKRKIVNLNSESVKIQNIASLDIQIPSKGVNVFTYDGAWLFERYRHKVTLESGTFINESLLFSSSHKHNPFLEIENLSNNDVYSFNILWSSNFREYIDIDCVKKILSIQVGINPYLFSYDLKPKESFITPEALMLRSSSSEENSIEMRKFVNNHIINSKWSIDRPILFNSWEGSLFNINENNLLKMADVCKEVGIELFVVDDGWFNNRYDSNHSLGDWFADKKKFPMGFGNFSKKIKSKGLKFGFWIEPEMISINSELYKNHPEYACKIPNREPLERRNQLMIDMSNPNVVNYLFDSLSKVIKETQPDYIKWDFNRNMSDAFSSFQFKDGEFMYHYMMGSYELMDRLTSAFPDILFEGCSSGGGRFDLGICYYFPQTWGSDNSNSYYRSFISCGTFAGYPQSTFGAHISNDCYSENNIDRSTSLDERFNIQALGCFGYEFNISVVKKEELNAMKEQIKFYKDHRKLFQYGELEIIDNIFDNSDYYSYELINENRSEIIFTAFKINSCAKEKCWKLKNLEENAIYSVNTRKHYNETKTPFDKITLTGKELMENGIIIRFDESLENKENFHGILSRMFYIKKQNN